MKKISIFIASVVALAIVASFAFADTETIRPNADGVHDDWGNWDCSDTNHWECVDEAVADTSDQRISGGNGQQETFLFANPTSVSGTINNIVLHYHAKQLTSTKKCFNPLIRASSTDYLNNNSICTNSSWSSYSETYTTNPDTGSAWTVSEINSLEAGMESTNPNAGGRVAQFYVVVDYTPYNNTCSDAESGIDLTTSGTVSGNFQGSSFSDTDSCSGDVLTEYVCNGDLSDSFTFDCSTIGRTCSNGACV